jgi:hypothetical protein
VITPVTNASSLALAWHKSSYSGAQTDCVETAAIPPHTIALRDSKRTTGPALLIGCRAMRAFTDSIRRGTLA